ncbi:MAG: OsmC family protein [Elusimicrobiota bacterium]|jgi:uncharacterized OsmC-like protein|nr:OsmC family protein [Elusimicrobiota bacterium]
MSKMITTYLGGGETKTLHEKNGSEIITDINAADGGLEKHFSATDLLATALAACTTTMIGKMAEARGDNLTGLKTEVEKIMAQNPQRVSKLILNVTFPPGTPKEKIDLYAKGAQACPVHNTLHDAVEIAVNVK